jgi:CheY-like chemotaxis protein
MPYDDQVNEPSGCRDGRRTGKPLTEKSMGNQTVLVVDDDSDNITFVETILKKEGFATISAGDGLEGFNKAAAELPDLIVLDVQMPKMNGFEVFTKLRAAESTKKIPIVMLTGIRDKIGRGYSGKDMKTFFGEGPNGYLEKPVCPEELLKIVKDIL